MRYIKPSEITKQLLLAKVNWTEALREVERPSIEERVFCTPLTMEYIRRNEMNSCTHGQLARQCEICELEKERDELRCELNLIREQVLSRDAELWGRTQEILKLRAQLAEYQKDAERYRFLRGLRGIEILQNGGV